MEKVYNSRMPDYHAIALQEALRRVASHAYLAVAVETVAAEGPHVIAQLNQAVIAEVPEFSRSRNPALLPETVQHGREHFDEILRILRGGEVGGLDFVHEHARRRAQQRFPMEATLHAYRSGHKVFSRWLREAALKAAVSPAELPRGVAAIVDFAMEYTDAISTAFAATYGAHALLLASVAGDQRSQLLQILLAGHDEADLRAARILRDAGFLDERQVFCLALARSVDPTEMLSPARARRLADAIERTVGDAGMRRVVDVHDQKVIAVFATVHRDSGWTAPRGSLAKRVKAMLGFVGNAAVIGVSTDVPSTSHIPNARREAAAALEMASAAERVVLFSEIRLQRLLLHYAAGDVSRVLPAWSRRFHAADAAARGALVATLRAYARVDMNVIKAGAMLGVHPNTIYTRLHRIAEISGLEPRSFEGLTDLLVVCDCHGGAHLPNL